MKNKTKSSLYFSAYPLKDVGQDSTEKPVTGQSPSKTVLNVETRAICRIRVFPMINPYKLSDATPDEANN